MGFFWIRFTAIAFCLMSIVVKSFGEPLLLRHPANGEVSRILTCVSEDDDSALIWNYNPIEADPNKGSNIFTNFVPKKPSRKNDPECAIWKANVCFVKWQDKNGWKTVNSSIEPMNPVHDFRWEDFRESVGSVAIRSQEYQYVGELSKYSASIVFSVRGKKNVHVFLCESISPMTKGQFCFWIILGGWNGMKSVIRTCSNGAPMDRKALDLEDCVDEMSLKREAEDVVHQYEWRTFTIKWITEKKTIQVFRDTDHNIPFIREKLIQWGHASHLSMRYSKDTRIRFHFYEYLLTKDVNVIRFSETFNHEEENFCLELLVGLCPKCKLNVYLVDEDNCEFDIGSIVGMENDTYNGLLTWRFARLNKKLENFKAANVKLKIQTIYDGVEISHQWAIDHFRVCTSVGQIRQSSIIAPRNRSTWHEVRCQKLSHGNSAVLDSLLTNDSPVRHLQQYIHNLEDLCGSACTGLGKYWSLCYQNGCTCARGFKGRDCNEECSDGDYGYNCDAECKPCDIGFCDKLDGLCDSEARIIEAPPAVKNLQIYDADPDTSFSLRWELSNSTNNEIKLYRVLIHGTKQIVSNNTLEVPEEGLKCRLWENCVCFENLLIPAHCIENICKIEVYAMNKKVTQAGIAAEVPFTSEMFNRPPSEPKNLTIISKGNGIMTLTWRHPSLSPTKITRFYIHAHFIRSELITHKANELSVTEEYVIKEDQEVYSLDLNLWTSTFYEVFIVAVNKRNSNSTPSTISVFVPLGVAFASEEELRVTQIGVLIEVEVPAVINATHYTRVQVIVKRWMTCAEIDSRTHSALEKSEWIAADYKVENDRPKLLEIGANHNHGVPWNCSLHLEGTYIVVLVIKDRHSSFNVTSSLITLAITTESQIRNLAWLVIFPITVLCVLSVFIWYKNRRRSPKPPKRPSYLEIVPLPSIDSSIYDSPSVARYPPKSSTFQPVVVEDQSSDNLYAVPNDADSFCISVEYFEEYVKQAAAGGQLYSQFMLLRKGLTRSYEYGGLPENISKNRDRNLVAYDDTRVILEKIPGDPYSDYINATYIKGYDGEKVYIATHGPVPNTVNDFWRMVWQEEVHVICMLTNLVEETETKCEKYWPDVASSVEYGDCLVSNTDNQIFADYTFRTFELSYRQDTRTVTHLHYTAWPSLGVPIYPQSLIAYLKKLNQTFIGHGPIVVHCSTGDDRTGTVILCDICLRQAAAAKEIDVTAVITKMRDSRANMVGTLQQYVLAHILIVESIVSLPTQIPCSDVLSKRMQKLRKRLPSHVQRLQDTAWQERILRSLAMPQPSTAKSMPSAVLAGIDSSSESPEAIYSNLLVSKCRQFHAVSVDGVKLREQYLASWLPTRLTVSDFWTFVTGRKIKLIIILQCSDPRNPTCCDIIPPESIVVPLLEIQVENQTKIDEEEYCTKEKLLLHDTSEAEAEAWSVMVLSCRGWGLGENGKPPTPSKLVSLWLAAEKIPRKEGETLVLCHDGVRACGLYLALSFLLERIAVEGECDVISAVRAVRRSDSKFMTSLVQFEYLYDAAVNYVERFQLYGNFR